MDEISAAQAATLTGLSERTIRRRIAAGALPARRIAPNRFGIDVRDLPQRHDLHDLASRVAELERRVALLEEGQCALPLSLLPAAPTTGDSGGESARGDDFVAESSVPAGALSQLLVQLVHEAERLGPLLAPGAPNTSDALDEQGEGRRRATRRSTRSRIGDAAG